MQGKGILRLLISTAATITIEGDNFGHPERPLAYEKAADLLDLALEISAQHFGMPYARIDERSGALSSRDRRRNTQRMLKALEQVFGDRLVTRRNEDGEMCVFLTSDRLRDLLELRSGEMAALDRAIDMLAASNDPVDADSLRELRTKIRLLAPVRQRTRLEVDYEALLGTSHVVARPGPSPRLDPKVMRPLAEALLAMKRLSFSYGKKVGVVTTRFVHPYGVIFGHRAYLVASAESAADARPVVWRIDRISDVRIGEEPAEVPAGFDIKTFAKRSFGAFHSDEEFGEVEWRFSPEVAENVLNFRFHPDQSMMCNDDGSVTVRFCASSHLEMAWALYPWGRHVEVIKPKRLKKMVEGYQRSDFRGVP